MKRITTPQGVFGPFDSVDVLGDRYIINGGPDLQFTVIGEGTVDDWIGPPPENPLAAEELAAMKAGLVAEVRVKRDEVEQAGFTYNGNVFDADMASVLRLVTAGFAVQGGPPGTQISWSAKDGAVVPLTPTTLKEAAGALVSRANAVHARARALVAQISAAPDAAAVNAIDITSGWPV